MSTKKGGDVNSCKNDEGATRKESKKVPETGLDWDRVQDGFDIWREESGKLLEKDLENLRREQASLAPENQKTEQQLKYESAWEGRQHCRFMHCVTETCQHCDDVKRKDEEPANPEGRKSEKGFLAYQKCVAGSSQEKNPIESTRKGKPAWKLAKSDQEMGSFLDQL